MFTANPTKAWSREEVYELVWSQPMTKLATVFCISNVAIGKNCRKLKIPLPSRGYWARKAAGFTLPRPPLPQLHEKLRIDWRKPEPKPAPTPAPPPRPATPTELEDLRDCERIDQMLAAGAFALKHPGKAARHSLLTATRQAQSARTLGDEPPGASEGGALNINVTKHSFRRALLVMGTAIAILEQHGVRVRSMDWRTGDRRRTWATIFGQEVNFKITEHYRRVRTPPPGPGEGLDPNRRKSEMVPSGELVFHVVSEHDYTLDKWCDTADTKLEAMVPAIVAAMMKTAVRYRRAAENQRIEEERKRQRIEELRRLKIEIETEEKRVAVLEQEANNWRRATQIREYARAVLAYYTTRGVDTGPESKAGRWMEWALQQADRLDPLADSPASILDRKADLKELPAWWAM